MSIIKCICKKIHAQKPGFMEPFAKPAQTLRLYRSLRAANPSSRVFQKLTPFPWTWNRDSLSPHKKFLPRTIKLGILHNFVRENILTFGIFSGQQENICRKQQLTREPVWAANLLPDSISSCHLYWEWKLRISNNLKNVNQAWAELLCLA